jgi:hypothetical protein
MDKIFQNTLTLCLPQYSHDIRNGHEATRAFTGIMSCATPIPHSVCWLCTLIHEPALNLLIDFVRPSLPPSLETLSPPETLWIAKYSTRNGEGHRSRNEILWHCGKYCIGTPTTGNQIVAAGQAHCFRLLLAELGRVASLRLRGRNLQPPDAHRTNWIDWRPSAILPTTSEDLVPWSTPLFYPLVRFLYIYSLRSKNIRCFSPSLPCIYLDIF